VPPASWRCVALAEKAPALGEKERRGLAREYGGKAVEALREAIRRGYNDIRSLQQDRTFEALRGRPDFLQLLAELEKKQQPGSHP
jgi:hypothetical protein